MPARTGFARVDHGELYYEISGSGEAVVFVHGRAGDCRHWDLQFEPFARSFQAVRYDVRGFGRSSLPEAGKSCSHPADLSALLDHLAIPLAHVVGWSMGSGIAIDFALTHQDRVRSVTSVGPWVNGFASPSVAGAFEAVRSAATTRGPAAALDAFVEMLADSIVVSSARERFRRIGRACTFWDFSNTELVHADPAKPLEPSAIERISELRTPLLVAVGQRDLLCMNVADFLMRSAWRPRKVVINGAGHLVQMENPEDAKQRGTGLTAKPHTHAAHRTALSSLPRNFLTVRRI